MAASNLSGHPVSGIREVAKRAGVSIATVSTVLNASGPVSAKARDKVLAAVAAVGYAPNGIAQSLRQGRSRLIGLVVSEIANPFFASLTREISFAAQKGGYSVIVCDTDEDVAREAAMLDVLRAQRVAGVILAPAGIGDAYRTALEARMRSPFVVIDRRLAHSGRDFVGLDNLAAGRLVTEYLLRLGHRRIAFVAGRSGVSTADDRYAGYLGAYRAAGLEPDLALEVRGDFRGEIACDAVQPLLTRADRPTAIIAANNLMALGTLQAAHDLGFRCPDDLSVAGIDDFPWSGAMRPRLTTVAQPVDRIGATAVERLLARVSGDEAGAGCNIELPPRLLIRDSCARVEVS